MGILDFEVFNAGHMLKQGLKNPDQLLLGAADPLGAKLWGGITGKNYQPLVNQWGGASDGAYQAAEAKGINTGAAKGMHQAAQAIASIYAGGALGGLGGSGGAAGGAGGAGAPGAAGLGVDAGYLGGASAGPGAMKAGLSVGPGYSGGGATGGLLSSSNLKTMGDMAGLAQQAGVFGGQQAPQAPSAGIPARQADFTGLLSAGRGQQMSGAERLMAQRAARRG